MAQLKVDPDRVLEMVEAMRVTTGDIEAELERLDTEVRRLQRAWTGEARDAYSRAQAEWTRRLTNMNRVLEKAAQRSEQVAARYTAASKAVAERWGGA